MKNLINSLILIYPLLISALMGSSEATRVDTPPVIDGQLDDIWQSGKVSLIFVQVSPVIQGVPTVESEVYFLYDNENAYLAGRFYQDRSTISSVRSRRDAELILNGDWAAWNIDPLNNGSSAYFITMNPSNAFRDGVYSNEEAEIDVSDTGWDSSILTATSIEDDYWTVEIRLPLKDIAYQQKPVQDWGLMVGRGYAANQEFISSNVVDINKPFEITNFFKLTGLSGFNYHKSYSWIPYTFGAVEKDGANGSERQELNTITNLGLDIKYQPSPDTRILATVRPDFAQLETDVDVINVSDVPTNFPEKRPFFIESSDLYPGIAVNTRNIGDILVGGKYRKSGEYTDLDVTGVLDVDNTRWLLSNLKRSDNRKYLAEVIGGVKRGQDNIDYNVTTHAVRWMYEKRLSLSNLIGTVNAPEGGPNEWETVNSVTWNSRTLLTGVSITIKSTLYNTNKVGFNAPSNQLQIFVPLKFTKYSETSRIRRASAYLRLFRAGLYSHPGLYDAIARLTGEADLYVNELIGIYQFKLDLNPSMADHFRYRNSGEKIIDLPYQDVFGNFGRAPLKQASYQIELISDQSKRFGGALRSNNYPVRSSRASFTKGSVYTRLGSNGIITYSQSAIQIEHSPYQWAFKQTIHRIQTEYNLSERMNLRLIAESNISDEPEKANSENESLNVNITYVWEYRPGSRLFIGVNQNAEDDFDLIENSYQNQRRQTVFLKVDRLF